MTKNAEAVKRWRLETKKRIVAAMGGKCQCCGYNNCIDALDLHHINPADKTSALSDLRANHSRWQLIVTELRKCILLCKICHVEVHAGVRELPKVYDKFNEEYVDYKEVGKPQSFCPVCRKEKEIHQKTCSNECRAITQRKVQWETVDLKKLYIDDKMPACKIAETLGVSDVAVRKRLVKLGLK